LEAENFQIFSGNLRTDELAFIPERRQTTDCRRNSYQVKASVCLNPANPKISEPNRAGLGGMRRSKKAPADDFPTLFKPTALISAKNGT